MKILWVVNMVFPEVAELIGKPTSASGGWLLDLSHGVAAYDDIELGIMTYYSGNEFKDITVNGIRHFLFPGGGKRLLFYTKKTELDCKKVVSIFMPDIIHLHGTEYAPALAMTKAVPEVKKLLTIQGIIKRISQEYYGGLSLYEILRFLKVEELLKLTKYSFSTKIIDCLDSECAVIAICWDKHSGYIYLKNENAAITVSNIDDIFPVLKTIVDNPKMIIEYSERATNCGKRNHKRDVVQEMLYSDFEKVICKYKINNEKGKQNHESITN